MSMSMSIYLPLTETLDFIQSPNSTSKTTDDPTLPFKQFLASPPCCLSLPRTKNPSNSTNLHNLPHTHKPLNHTQLQFLPNP